MSNKAVAAKIIKAWGHIGSIPKNGKNSNFNYKFVREEDAADACRNAFMKVGLSCVPSVEKLDRSMFKTAKGTEMHHVIVTMKFTLTDQDTGETDSFIMVGEAMDVQDKAVYKAITGCTKYAYVKLAMSGAEDNEDEDVGERAEKTGQSNIPAGGAKPVQQGATYRKPEETTQQPSKASEPAKKADPQPTTKQPEPKPVDKPMSTRTEPPAQETQQQDDTIPTLEEVGKITAVIPAMKGKPATISFKPKGDGIVFAINFDPTKTNVPELLKLQQGKVDVGVICDISSGNPFLMHIST